MARRASGSRAVQDARLEALIGQPLNSLYASDSGVLERWRPFEFPLWDLVGRREGVPVYRLAAAINGHTSPQPLRVPCYDTSLYFDDLHLKTTGEAAELIVEEAREGYARGHRAFKIKVGGARGTCRCGRVRSGTLQSCGRCERRSAPIAP